MNSKTYLVQSRKPYHHYLFRMNIPQDLRDVFPQREFRISLKDFAVLTASWPVIESTTNRVSEGLTAAWIFSISFIRTSDKSVESFLCTSLEVMAWPSKLSLWPRYCRKIFEYECGWDERGFSRLARICTAFLLWSIAYFHITPARWTSSGLSLWNLGATGWWCAALLQ